MEIYKKFHYLLVLIQRNKKNIFFSENCKITRQLHQKQYRKKPLKKCTKFVGKILKKCGEWQVWNFSVLLSKEDPFNVARLLGLKNISRLGHFSPSFLMVSWLSKLRYNLGGNKRLGKKSNLVKFVMCILVFRDCVPFS